MQNLTRGPGRTALPADGVSACLDGGPRCADLRCPLQLAESARQLVAGLRQTQFSCRPAEHNSKHWKQHEQRDIVYDSGKLESAAQQYELPPS